MGSEKIIQDINEEFRTQVGNTLSSPVIDGLIEVIENIAGAKVDDVVDSILDLVEGDK